MNIYNFEEVNSLLDMDEISSAEAGFMIGYLGE